MRAHSSGRVTSFVTMRVRWRKILRLTRQIVRSCSEYHPRVRHIHVKIIHSECVLLALGIYHVMRMRHTVICGLSAVLHFFMYLINWTMFEKKLLGTIAASVV
jgi:hypothetical protein